MGRWEPDAVGRLQQAALELYAERGFESTAVADIAERAGLTERTFLPLLRRQARGAVSRIERAAGPDREGRPPTHRRRCRRSTRSVSRCRWRRRSSRTDKSTHVADKPSIAANSSLQERELIKMASLSAAVAASLHGRGVPDPAATLTAEAGIAVFKIAFERWLDEAGDGELSAVMADTLRELRAVTGR